VIGRRLRAFATFFWVAACLLISPIAQANDTTARVDAGGLVLLKNEHIEMVEEHLTISIHQIEVRYRFRNTSDQPVVTKMAFPMPPHTWNPRLTMLEANNKPFGKFETVVNGRNIPSTRLRVASLNGKDITGRLRTLGLSDREIFETFAGSAGQLKMEVAKDIQLKLRQIGAADEQSALWAVEETAIWDMVFPPKKDVIVSHRYKPLVGMAHSLGNKFQLRLGSGVYANEACEDEKFSRYFDKKMGEWARPLKASKCEGSEKDWDRCHVNNISLFQVGYVLGTGRNWKGPIGNFRLTVKLPSDKSLVSLCFLGKALWRDKRTVEFLQKDFVPPDKLAVHFYEFSP
jgi:hypothetical protein